MKIRNIFLFALTFTFVFSNAFAANRSLFEQTGKTVDALLYIRSEIDNKYKTYLNSQGNAQKIVEEKLPLLEIKINTLSEQLSVLDANLSREQSNLDDIQQQIKSVQLELADLQELADMREVEMARSQDILNEFIRISYAETMQYTDWKTGEVSTLKFLFTDSSFSDIETKKVYLEVLQNISVGLILDLQDKQERYGAAKNNLLEKRGELIVLQQEVIDRARNIQSMRDAKAEILAQTQGQEAQFRRLVEESKKQEAEALAEIMELKSQMSTIDAQLQSLKSGLSEDEFQSLLGGQSIASFSGLIFPDHMPRLLWPASPARGITAYFQDPSYKSRFGVAHQAVDFRLPQGSQVSAAAPGIVYKAKDNGFGYSYVTIAHPGKIATVYGHISKIMVKEGDIVQAGDLIGLSGGIPGTKGAGYMTTGAHLHFEVIDNGEHKNPLDYLPLEKMRKRDIPQEYLEGAIEL